MHYAVKWRALSGFSFGSSLAVWMRLWALENTDENPSILTRMRIGVKLSKRNGIFELEQHGKKGRLHYISAIGLGAGAQRSSRVISLQA